MPRPPDRTSLPTTQTRRVVDQAGMVEHQAIGPRAEGTAMVGSIMSRTAYCMRPDVGVATAASILLEERMSGAPVVDGDGRPIGIVSKTDLLRHLHERGDAIEPATSAAAIDAALGAGFHGTRVDETTVADVMMPVVFAIPSDTEITAAAALMAGEGVHRLPVLGGDGAVVGILSALDIVRWVAVQAGHRV